MRIHILGICGTFMGGIAAIAQAAGHTVTGCDANVYPPMSTQLEAQGIKLIEGWGVEQLSLDPDVFVIGNVVARGNPLMEEILNRGLPYISGPQWLAENVLRGLWVLAVAGTHGKTTTTAMLAWILEYAGLAPGFLIGGVPENFGVSARLPGSPPIPAFPREGGRSENLFPRDGGRSEHSLSDDRGRSEHSLSDDRGRSEHSLSHDRGRSEHSLPLEGGGPGWGCDTSPFFVIEADEYDTAFCDKRSKFVHYSPRTAVLNNLEFDHADIFPDLAAIETQFHHLVRTLPANGLIVANGAEASLQRVLDRGCWTPVERFGTGDGWQADPQSADGSFGVSFKGTPQGIVRWALLGVHNQLNALAALAAARHAGVPPALAIEALASFRSVKRRLELRGVVNGITLYDDFAHHPTAIAATLEGLKQRNPQARHIAVLELRSNSMRSGVHREHLAGALSGADLCYLLAPSTLTWDLAGTLATLGERCRVRSDTAQIISELAQEARSGDQILVMSNGGFEQLPHHLLQALQRQMASTTPP